MLPARALHTVPLQNINYDLAETIGWPQLVALAAREYRSLPALTARTDILTGNYGEAGAIAATARVGLPQAYSGANNFWLWGPPRGRGHRGHRGQRRPGLLRREFGHVRPAATFWNGLGVSDDEQGVRIYWSPACGRPGRRPGPLSAITPEVAGLPGS